MNEDDVIKIVKELFDTEIYGETDDPFRGADIMGKEQFFDKLKVRLKELFNDNDLSK